MKNTIHILFILLISLIGYQIVEISPEKKVAQIVDGRSYYKSKKLKRERGEAKLDQPEMYGIIQQQLRTPLDANVPQYPDNYLVKEFKKAKKLQKAGNLRNELNFVARGPGNIAGRTRALLVDPRDENQSTWIAGSASGGVWKTVDAGKNWTNISGSLTSLSTNNLAMSPANPDVIYVGTGEHFINDTDGNGLWKSEDGGESWRQIASPDQYEGFKNVSRIAVDPDDENIIVVSTSNGSWVEETDYAIWKSTNGGETFERTYTSFLGRVDDLNANPKNFNVMYAALRGYGVIKSLDAGETWFEPGDAIPGIFRVEIDVSELDTSRVWASASGGASSAGSTIYISLDGAETFTPLNEEAGEIDYLGGQGFYDNIITAHPYNVDEAYVGGVNLFKVSIVGEGGMFTSFKVEENGTDEFLTFISGTNFEREATIPTDQINSIEIRFGQGSQMAHRFIVGNQGAGVPFGTYQYADFVEVPFTVWDTDNDIQLAVSIRDQNEDGDWDLIPENTDEAPEFQSREYIFVHDVAYEQQEVPSIAEVGGVETRLMYFIWPALTNRSDVDVDNLPVSELVIDKLQGTALSSATAVLSDAYGSFNSINNFSNSNFINQEGLHPDQHNIVIVKENEEEKTFRFIVTNDGGVYITKESIDPGAGEGDFIYAGFGYVTSQFYGADKAPGSERYIGGMQDNSTWFTPEGAVADSSTTYDFAFGGDGFESIWNNSNPAQLIGGSQFNNFARSLDGGETWQRAVEGITEGGPFITRLANSKRKPNRLFTLGPSGVWKSEDFGGNWTLSAIEDRWSFNNSADVEVSYADPNTIWAGGFLSENSRVYVSQDAGQTFEAVNNYDEEVLGIVSGIGTHPIDRQTGYLLFSFAGKPKVLKTEDLGQTWDDISGFAGNNGVSDRGFPDVAIQSLLVFPNNTSRIWVGSEIGIIESLDGGASWNLLECNMPPVNIHEFKIQDDQIVIATYGRGIWSVDVEGIEQDFVLQPSITEATQKIGSGLLVNYYLPSVYDSSKIYINGEIVKDLGATERGAFESSVDLDAEGEISIEIQSFVNDTTVFSLPFTLETFVPGAFVTQYENDFGDEERASEFSGFGFRFALETGFSSPAIHSDHPYPDAVDYTYLLTQPYILTEESDNQLQYREVVIVEPGEEGSIFGEDEFWDYVIVEGSQDGQNWVPLAPGYDSRDYEQWVVAYEQSNEINENLYEFRQIDLLQTYGIGDTILVRFRLNSDQFVNGWGWAIDNLEIGNITSSLNEVNAIRKAKLFPNPVRDVLQIETRSALKIDAVQVLNTEGKLIYNEKGGLQTVSLSHLPQGTYFLRLFGPEISETHQFIKL